MLWMYLIFTMLIGILTGWYLRDFIYFKEKINNREII